MTQPPEHSGLRPLGPYGEGYCRACHFILALTADGLIERHSRGSQISPRECEGSWKRAPKATPYASRKARFISTPRRAQCHVCKREEMPLLADGRLAGHLADPYRPGSYCKGGYQLPGRDHGGERG